MIDTGRVRAKLALLGRYRERLARLAALHVEDYLAGHDLEGRYAVEVDDRLVHAYLQEGLEDLDAFARTIAGLGVDDTDASGQ